MTIFCFGVGLGIILILGLLGIFACFRSGQRTKLERQARAESIKQLKRERQSFR